VNLRSNSSNCDETEKFSVFFPVSWEFRAETSSQLTASSASWTALNLLEFIGLRIPHELVVDETMHRLRRERQFAQIRLMTRYEMYEECPPS
jgi:hypothetical protein